jgi:transposase InsO family protein
MEQRVLMLAEWDTGAFSVSHLCRRYGVSRDVFYHWRARRAGGLADWFEDGSHAPLHCPHRTPVELAERIVAVKLRFPHFGPKKVLAFLRRDEPGFAWPAASTIGTILDGRGLVRRRRRRRGVVEQGSAEGPASLLHAEWSMDFKGWFRTGDGRRCDPLTVSERSSRYLVAVRIVSMREETVRSVLEQAFREHGLPEAIRVDNGPPFGCTGAGGLSRLGVWLLKLGVQPHYIRPSSPQENGRHERMHRTLKAQTARPPAADALAQQARFDAFRQHYNEERPHEALGQATPASLWRASPRPLPERPLEPDYPPGATVRRVRSTGEIKWRGGFLFLSETLIGERVCVEETGRGQVVRFYDHDLGLIDIANRFRRFAPLRHRLREAAEADP